MEIKTITAQERADRRKQWRGLGDVIASATRLIGLKPCPSCKKRQANLNRAISFKIAPQ